MERVIMASGILAGIVITLIGLFKLAIKQYKGKGWYKPLLTALTLILAVGLSLLCETFILELPIISWSCVILIISTTAEVFVSYNGIYEGFNIKTGIQNLLAKWKELKELSPEAKAVRKVEKVENDLIELYQANKDVFNTKIFEIRKKAEKLK